MIISLVYMGLTATFPWQISAKDSGPSRLARVRTRFALAEDSAGRSWFLGRDGRKFLSLGVCAVDQGAPKAMYDFKNPGYAAYRYYTTAAEWAQDTVDRLQRWGFNTIGAWSDSATLRGATAPNIYFTPILHIGSSAGAPWRDMWDPKTVQLMDQVGRDGIQKLGGADSRVIGYFSDNEMGWWEAAMFDWGFKAGARSRKHLADLFRAEYHGNWSRLRRDFDAEGASSFGELQLKGRLYLHPGGHGMRAVQKWMTVVANRYYYLCNSIIKKYDPGALYLGDRYISNFYPEVARASSRYVDVSSTNLNADWNDGSFARFYLPALRRATGKPILVTEYYASARENRTGNLNNSSGFPVVQTQTERAQVFADSTRFLLSNPGVVGAHWFQYYDEPKNGRGDGENYDFGLVDNENRPYEQLTATSRSLDLRRIHKEGAPEIPDARSGIPVLATDRVAELASWPRAAAYVPPLGLDDRADLYLTHKGGSLFVALYWNEDRFGEAFYPGGHIPVVDRASFKLRIAGQQEAVTARLAEGLKPLVTGATLVKFAGGVRNLAVFRVPIGNALGRNHRVTLDASLETRARAYTCRWHLAGNLRQ